MFSMANTIPTNFPIYSADVVSQKSLKQTLRIYAERVHCYVFYTFVKTALLRPFQPASSQKYCHSLLISILAVIVSAILFLLLYPVKLTFLAISLCLKDPKTTTVSLRKSFVRNLQDMVNRQLFINSDYLSVTPESSPFLTSFLIPETQSWESYHLEDEILELYSTLPEGWEKILNYADTRNQDYPSKEMAYEGSLYLTVLHKLTTVLQDPLIPKKKKQELLNYIGTYADACPPTWIEVIFKELTAIYNKRDTSINYIILCVQTFKENLLQSMVNRSSEEWHHISGFKHYHGGSLGLNMNSLARIQFTGHLILQKQALYNRVFKRFLSNYRASVANLIEYTRCQIIESSQELKNSLSRYLCETMTRLEVPENEISSVLSSLFYDEHFELNNTGIAFILIMQGILTTEAQTAIGKIAQRLPNLFRCLR